MAVAGHGTRAGTEEEAQGSELVGCSTGGEGRRTGELGGQPWGGARRVGAEVGGAERGGRGAPVVAVVRGVEQGRRRMAGGRWRGRRERVDGEGSPARQRSEDGVGEGSWRR